jgi:hypothetical protein
VIPFDVYHDPCNARLLSKRHVLFVFGSHLSRPEIGRFSAVGDPSGVVHKATLVCAECRWTSFQIKLKEDVPAYLLKVKAFCPHFPWR